MSESKDRRRWFRIACRTLHLGGVAGVVGAVLHSPADVGPWAALVLVSGLGLLVSDLTDGHPYLAELRGAAMAVKLLVIAAAVAIADLRAALLFVAIAIGSVVSHMPGRLRHKRLLPADRGRAADGMR